MICFKCGTQGYKEDACPHDKSREKDNNQVVEMNRANLSKPEEESTYRS